MRYAIGLDVSDKDVTSSCVTPVFHAQAGLLEYQTIWYAIPFEQTPAGYAALIALMRQHQIPPSDVTLIMESTGVYSERLSHFLYDQGLPVCVEPPLKIHAAFYERGKTDPIDSRQIGEYGFRFADQLHLWHPREAIIDQIATLLTMREQLVKMQTASKNFRKSLQRKHQAFPDLLEMSQTLGQDFKQRITTLETAIRAQIATNPLLQQTTDHLLLIKSAGFLLVVNFLVMTEGYTQHLTYQDLASYSGVCPFEHRSGTSVYRRPQADGAGPERLRKLLYLAAMRVRQTNPEFKTYYERKVKAGKSGRLVLTNIENRLLKLMCGVVKSGKPYIEGYTSAKPG